MKAFYLVKNGKPQEAFELRETETPAPGEGEVLVESEAFGLNFADIMARMGLYQDCPPLPTVIGYENVGRIKQVGPGVEGLKEGDRVVAFTRFGGYADHVISKAVGVAKIPDDMPAGKATALATQYGTAWYAAEECITLFEGDNVLIHAAAGGVGTALVQIARRHNCTIFGTASPQKHDFLREQGVHHPIDYRSQDFEKVINELGFGGEIDAIFDPVGGQSVKKDKKLLSPGGRLVLYGASSMTDAKGNPLKMLGVALGFGFSSPIPWLTSSKSLIGVNMLRIADHRPQYLKKCLEQVVALTAKGELNPQVGGEFEAGQLAEAHEFLGSRKSMGKVVVKW